MATSFSHSWKIQRVKKPLCSNVSKYSDEVDKILFFHLMALLASEWLPFLIGPLFMMARRQLEVLRLRHFKMSLRARARERQGLSWELWAGPSVSSMGWLNCGNSRSQIWGSAPMFPFTLHVWCASLNLRHARYWMFPHFIAVPSGT